MVLIKLFGEPKCKDSNEYFFSMEMKTRLECIQNIDKICYLMSDTDLTKIYPAYEPVANSDSWSVTVFDYINETNLDFERLQEPTPKDGWTGLTLTFTQKGTEFEWHIDPRHYDFNRKETAYVDKSKISTIDDIYSLKMDSAQEKIEALDCILCYVKTNDSYVFNELLQNWLHSNSNYFAGWKNPKLNLRLIEVLLKYWAIDEVLNAGVPELYDALVWVLVRDYRFKEAMHVLDVDAANAVKSPDSVNFPKQNNARALSQTIKFCSDEQLLKLSDLGVNEYCHMVLGTTLLHLAAGAGNINLSSSLSKLGIDIDTVDSEGKTAIHRAIDSNCTVTVLNLLNQNASIPRFNYIDLLKYITTEAYHEIIQFDGPVHPITSAGGEAAHQEKKHKISSKIQFVKGIETSKWSAAKEIQYILSKFKFNFINIYHDNALLLQCINGNLQTDNFYDLAFKNDFFIQLCNVLRNKCFEQNLVGESNSYTSLYQPAIDKDIRHLDFPALVLPEIFNLSKDPIHQMFLIFLYDAEAGKINISKLSALAANGFNINSDLLAHFKKIAEDKEYLNSQRAQSEWRSLLSRVNDGNKFKIRYLADGTMAPGIKNLLRAFASLLGNSLHLDMAMQTKHACLKNINSLCHFFSENELGEWNPNTFNKYWTVNIANYGFADDQDACSLLETLSEDQDWTDISFVFSYGSMSKNRSSIFELNVNQNGYSISATPIALRLNRLDNASREAVQEFLKPHSHDFYQWRNQYINLLVVKTLLKSYTMHQILSFNVPFLYEALLWEAIKTKNAADVKLILTRDAQLESNQPKSLSFSALAKVLAYTLRHADSDDLQLLLKSGASEYATRVTGASLLHLISASGNAPLLKAMLATCDDVNIKDSDGRTALHYATASRLNSSSMISILLENGANINAVDNNLESPLFIVADQIRNEVARILIASTLFLFRDPFCDLPGFDISLFGLFIKAGAYFDINYRKGQSFFDFAIKYCNQSVVNLMHEQLEAALANPQNEIKSLFEPSPADKYHPGDVLTVISFTGCGPKGFIGATEMACHYLHNNREWCRPHIKGNTIYGFYGNVLPMFKDMQEDIRHMFPDIAKYSDEEFDKEARKRHFKDEKTTAAFLKLLEERFGAFVIVRPKIKSSQQIIAETQERQLKHFFTLFKPEAKITCVTAVIDGDSEVEFLVDNHPHLK